MIRTLGRVGVPVYAVIEDGVTPASTSRYLTGRVRISSDGVPDQTKYLDRLVEAIDRLPAKPLLVCTDDEAAVLVAEGAVCWPIVRSALPSLRTCRASSPAHGLHELCRRLGVATPATSYVRTGGDLDEVLAEWGFPVVVKQTDLWRRLTHPVVTASTVVRSEAQVGQLRAALDRWPDGACVVVQQYLPEEEAEDWFAHGYCAASTEVVQLFTGRKMWSWPARAGATAYARTERTRRSSGVSVICVDVSATAASSTWTGDTTVGRERISCSISTLELAPNSGCSRTTAGSTWSGRCTSISQGVRCTAGAGLRGSASLSRTSASQLVPTTVGSRNPLTFPMRPAV